MHRLNGRFFVDVVPFSIRPVATMHPAVRRLSLSHHLRIVQLAFAAVLLALYGIAFAQGVDPTNYRLAAGDSIHISVFQNPDLAMDTRIAEDGSITFPLIGRIVLGNTEIAGAEQKMAKALLDGGFLKNPQVSIQLVEVRGTKVSVLGQVNRPGSFPIESTNTLLSQVLAQAGGVMPTGADKVIVTGTRDRQPMRREVDIDALYRESQPEDDIVVRGGDTIYVPRAPMFYIYGEVTRPGNYRVDRNMTFRQAIAAAGGLTLRGTERRLSVTRPDSQGASQSIRVDLNDLIVPGDTIRVSESIF